MSVAYANSGEFSFFSDAQAQFGPLISQLSQEDNDNNKHGDIHTLAKFVQLHQEIILIKSYGSEINVYMANK